MLAYYTFRLGQFRGLTQTVFAADGDLNRILLGLIDLSLDSLFQNMLVLMTHEVGFKKESQTV